MKQATYRNLPFVVSRGRSSPMHPPTESVMEYRRPPRAELCNDNDRQRFCRMLRSLDPCGDHDHAGHRRLVPNARLGGRTCKSTEMRRP